MNEIMVSFTLPFIKLQFGIRLSSFNKFIFKRTRVENIEAEFYFYPFPKVYLPIN